MTQQEAQRNIFLYYLHVVFNDGLFLGVILVTLLTHLAHMTVADVFFMVSVTTVVKVLLEIPSGVLSDLIGRKRTIILARIFDLAGMILLTFMANPLHAWLSYLLHAIGMSLQSGADTSLVYETLKEAGRDDDFKRVRGNAWSWRLWVKASCALFSGVLASIDMRLPLLIGLPFTAIPLVMAFLYKEPERPTYHSIRHQLAELAQGLRAIKKSDAVRWIVGFSMLLAMSSSLWYWYNPYYEMVGIPLWLFGLIGFSTSVAAGLGSRFGYRIERYIGEKWSVVVLIVWHGVPMVLMSLVPHPLMACLVPTKSFVGGASDPFIGDYMNKRIENAYRNTLLSIHSAMCGVTEIAALALFGFIVGYAGLLHTVTLFGFAALALGALSYRAYTKL